MKDELQDKEKKKKEKIWWKRFWITVVILASIYIILQILVTKKIIVKKPVTEEIVMRLQRQYPQLKAVLSQLPNGYKVKIKEEIDKNIDMAYAGVYKYIDKFADFHYSVTGEYTEIFETLSQHIDKMLMEKIFKPAHFEENLNKALKNINNDTNDILNSYYAKLKNEVKNRLDINKQKTDFLFENILKLTQEDMQARFNNSVYNSFRAFGIGGGVTAAVITKVVSKKISAVLAKKIAIKAATKAGAKAGGVLAGAAAGGESGLLCGPGAWLCSPIGAVVGGIIGWFATDKIVVEVDKYFNEDEFKNELKKMIDKQKEATKQTFYKIYLESFDKMNNENIVKFEEIKNKKIKDLIKGSR